MLRLYVTKLRSSSVANLTFFRLKAGITDPDRIIKDRNSRSVMYSPVRIGDKKIGDLYVRRVERSRPTWLTYFGKSVDTTGMTLRTASLAAVLLINHDNEFYAVVFGYGKSLLQEGVVEDRFGLRATLNCVEPSRLRSIDHKRLEAISRHTREQLSRDAGLDQFGLDVDRDLLRAVTGSPADKSNGSRLSGADSLTVTGDLPLDKLGETLARYGKLAEQTTYVENFPWVDHVRDVRDSKTVDALNKRLASMIQRDQGDVWLSPPEIIDWSTTKGFRYRNRNSATVYSDLILDEYFAEYGVRGGVDSVRLNGDRVWHVRADDDNSQHSWPILRCLIAEVELYRRRYVINEGRWYEINPDFIKDVDRDILALLKTRTDLPKYADASEGAYTKRVAKRDKTFAHLDQKSIPFPGRSKVEVCDLYKDRTFVHVKRYSASSTLSHLFAQGTVSAELMVKEPSFRAEFRKRLDQRIVWDAGPTITPSEYEVCYAIVQRPGKPLTLPFFSKVSLRANARSLKAMGFKVSLTPIDS